MATGMNMPPESRKGQERRMQMTKFTASSFLQDVDVLELALETVQRSRTGRRVGDRFRSSVANMFAITVDHFGKALGRWLASHSTSMDEAGVSEFEVAFRDAARLGLISGEACERWIEYRVLSRKMASLDGKVFTETVLSTFPVLLEDTRDLVGVMAGCRESEELELSDHLRRQVEQILRAGGSPAGEQLGDSS